MASGCSSRMGVNKLLLPVEGVPAVQRVLAAVLASSVGEAILVYQNDEVKEIGEALGVKTIYNPHSRLGQSEAVKAGVSNASVEAQGYMFFVGDQPFISGDVINRLIRIFRDTGAAAVVPRYNGKRGNPVLFSSAFKEQLLALEGDAGGRVVLDSLKEGVVWVDIEEEQAGLDMDTMEDYSKIQEMEKKL
jgi:molybdenum cofactor cytidylyltransferase